MSSPQTDGTCIWILHHPHFLKWIDDDENPMLWIQGLPGRGKSVMASFLQEHLGAQGRRTLFYRFQRSASETGSTATVLAASIIHQLLESPTVSQTSGAIIELDKLSKESYLGPQHCPFQMIWTIARSLLISTPRFYLIIDALDECKFDGNLLPDIVTFIEKMLEAARKVNGKILIFSRPDPQFSIAREHGVLLHMAEDEVAHDVITFARNEYERLRLPIQERGVVLQRIGSSSHGSFWWSRLFLDYLSRSLQTTEFQIRLRGLPPSIEEFYRSALLNPPLRLRENEVECRRAILLMYFQAQRTLKISEIEDALSLRPEISIQIISNLCRPLVNTEGGFFNLAHPSVREFFESCEHTNDTSLGFSFSDSHALLAEKCLTTLSNEKYADKEHVKQYLHVNYDEEYQVNPAAKPKHGSFYHYASRYWYHHLIQTSSPSPALLQQANKFLLNLQFAFWVEYSRKEFGQFIGVTGAVDRLKSWRSQVSVVSKTLADIDHCFATSYKKLSTAYKADGEGGIYQWLARLRLCDYYLDLGSSNEEVKSLDQIASTLRLLLKPNHPVVLRATATTAYARLHAGKIRAAWRIYGELAKSRREVVGDNDIRFVEALHFRGESEYYLTNFEDAIAIFAKTSTEFLRLRGLGGGLYLAAQVWYGMALAQMGQLEASLEVLQTAMQKRQSVFGLHDALTKLIRIAMADVLRAVGRHEEAIEHFQDIAREMRASFSPCNKYRLDIEIILAKTYLEANMIGDAKAIIEEIEIAGTGSLRRHFKRFCQIRHIKGLLLAKDGFATEAIDSLQGVLTEAEQDQDNRALLWIRLDLAMMLRGRNDEGDRYQASANFNNIVKDVSGNSEPGFLDEPDPPRLLDLAEKALTLVRKGHCSEARLLFDSEHLDWHRPSDLWLWVSDTVFL
ncbi:hypothetical protein F4806DRAFT_475357 [Annulohypoxylon nitens]|nr:hypothetical protein F4806DRAFT_475357 [Annulohypoxylon nitens]